MDLLNPKRASIDETNLSPLYFNFNYYYYYYWKKSNCSKSVCFCLNYCYYCFFVFFLNVCYLFRPRGWRRQGLRVVSLGLLHFVCVSVRVWLDACPCVLQASRSHYNTIYLENIYKGLQTQTCSVVAVIDRVFSGFPIIILLLRSLVKDGNNTFHHTVNCGGQTGLNW